jgi:hypothetical protein
VSFRGVFLGKNATWRLWFAQYLQENALTAIESAVIPAKIGIAKLVAVSPKGAKRGIIARGVAKLPVTLRMISPAIVSISRTIFGAGTKSLMLGALYQRGNSTIRWRRRRTSIVACAAGNRQAGHCNQEKCGVKVPERIHEVLTYRFAPHSGRALASFVRTLNR